MSIFSVTPVCLYGQSRIFFAMAGDKINPESLGKITPPQPQPKHWCLGVSHDCDPIGGGRT